MTNDFDELLSAYIDDEATPTEVARVEGDAELLAAAATLRGLAGEVSLVPAADASLRSRQLAAALEAFDQLPTADSGRAEVVSLEGRARRRQRQRSSGLPNWLGAAAAAALVVGGIGYLASQGASSDDSATSAAGDTSDDGDFEDAGGVAEETEAADDAGAAALEVDASTDEESNETSQFSESAGNTSAADADEAAAQSLPLSTTTTPELLDRLRQLEERRVPFDTVPTPSEQAELAAGELLDPELASCGPEVGLPTAAGRLIGFVPLAIDGTPAELLVFDTGSGELTPSLVDGSCQPR